MLHASCGSPAFRGDSGVAIFPSLAIDGNGALSVTFYEANPFPGTLAVHYAGHPNPQNVTQFGQFQPTPLAGGFAPPDALKGIHQTVVQPLGSYFGIAPRSSITGTVSEPGCEGNGSQIQPTFSVFPFWVQRAGTSPAIATCQVVLTP